MILHMCQQVMPHASADITRCICEFDRTNRAAALLQTVRVLISTEDDMPFNGTFSIRCLKRVMRRLDMLSAVDDVTVRMVQQACRYRRSIGRRRISSQFANESPA